MQTLKESPAGWVEPELSLLYVCNNYKSGKKSKQTQQPQNEKLTNLKQDFFHKYHISRTKYFHPAKQLFWRSGKTQQVNIVIAI